MATIFIALTSITKRAKTTFNSVGVALFASLFLVFVVQVVARFAFNQPLAWSDEAAVILYLWSVLWGAALVCKDREQVAFDLLYQSAPPQVRRAMALGAALLVGLLCAWALPAVFDYIYFMRRESTAVLGLPFHWVFLPFALLMVALVLRYALRVMQLLGRNWAQHL
jgi:TRAP-type C4-dicarboxylate transport system permease small subunit